MVQKNPKGSKRIQESKGLKCHFDSAPIPHQILFEFTPMSICLLTSFPGRFHFEITSSSLGCHSDFTSMSLRFDLEPTSISIRCHFDATGGLLWGGLTLAAPELCNPTSGPLQPQMPLQQFREWTVAALWEAFAQSKGWTIAKKNWQ